jgi:predicted phage-related endonuclease
MSEVATVPLDRRAAAAYRKLAEIKKAVGELDGKRKELETVIKECLGAAEIGTVRGVPVVKWTTAIRQNTSLTDLRKLARDDEHLRSAMEGCTRLTEVRTFTLVDPA